MTFVQTPVHRALRLLGLRGLVFKSHGGAEAEAYEWAIRRAYDAAKNDVQEHLSALIANAKRMRPSTSSQVSQASSRLSARAVHNTESATLPP